MNVLESPCWYAALTLKERLAALERAGGALPSSAGEVASSQRLKQWREQVPFGKADLFARRLAAEGLSQEMFAYLLDESMESVRSRFDAPPPWLDRLDRAFTATGTDAEVPAGSQDGEPSFIEIASPLVADGLARFRQAIDTLSAEHALPFDRDTAVATVARHLELRLAEVLERTLVLELNVARLRGELEGDTPQARFRTFLLSLRARKRALTLLSEYPVLARQLVRAVENGVAFHLEFFRRLSADWELIRHFFSGDQDPGKLEEVSSGLGDSHRRGRSVLLARFSSGTKVVYKPRSLALDVHFQELLSWLNACGQEPPLRTIRSVDRGDYGWVEFVEARGCSTPEEVRRFFQRQGAYLALLYALDATDFHSENLVAQGEHPVLLDLEALFHARLQRSAASSAAQRAALEAVEDSVLRAGLLPQRIWGTAEAEGVDISGLGSSPGQMTPFEVPRWRAAGTDEMHLGRERMVMPVGTSRPSLGGAEVDVLEHADAIATGFVATYRLLEQQRAALLATDGPLARFAADEVRVILRPTQTYGVLLREGFHPDVLHDELDRAQLFDRLWGPVEHQRHLARVIPAELEDLAEGDVPMFTARPGSVDLWTSSGVRLPDFFDEPSLSHVHRLIGRLGAEDRERQLWFVRASLATVSKRSHTTRGADAAQASGVVDRDELLAAARAVGDELERRVVREGADAAWIGLSQFGERHWQLAPLGSDLYDGVSGVALFLGYLAAATGEERYSVLARAGLRAARLELKDFPEAVSTIGGFGGLGGVIHTLVHLGALWRDGELIEEARAAVNRLPALVERDEYLDIIGGAAGCIGILLSLQRHAPSPAVLAVAKQCGERLLATARPADQGSGWLTKVAKERPLSGFSHGAAGIAWALLRLADVTGEERFRQAGLQGIAYERTLFSPEQGNWWDLRYVAEGTSQACAAAWCHGAPGIGLSRLDLLGSLDDDIVRQEIQVAVKATVRFGFGDNHSLCHGDLGNLELLSSVARTLGDSALRTMVAGVARAILDDVRVTGWRCGNPMRVESPGLMTGLAGIGYGLLRLADPERVPSILLLEPPRAETR